jgi:ribosomal protein S18 acetylase RimI-like enzyme
MTIHKITYRQEIKPTDVAAIETIIRSSGFFSAEEIDIAQELAEEKLELGAASSYQFLFAENEDIVFGYSCFGLIPMTSASYDIYWIAVNQHLRSKGLGKKLMEKSEEIIRSLGGKRVYVETASRKQYQTTHSFYQSCGYHQAAFLEDFYAEGDGKIIYVKILK